MQAKQFVTVGYDGHMVGDCILFCLAENHVRLVGRPPALNWVQYHAETGPYDVSVRLDPRTANNPKGRELFRLQLQGPLAGPVFDAVNGGPMPEIPFFRMGKFHVGKHEVTALNHRMSGFPGLEFFGPYEEFESVRDTLLEAGADHGLRQIGARAYASVATESGWVANTVPAIYTGPAMKAYREWLPKRGFEGNLALAGSYVPDRTEDLYVTPWDLGYGKIIKFDHEFIGRDALERLASQPHRRKVWLFWNRDDVAKIFASMYEPGDQRFKYIEMPAAFYGGAHVDRVEKDGRLDRRIAAGHLLVERPELDLPRDDQRGRPGVRLGGRARVGRAGRRVRQPARGTAHADHDPRDRVAPAVPGGLTGVAQAPIATLASVV